MVRSPRVFLVAAGALALIACGGKAAPLRSLGAPKPGDLPRDPEAVRDHLLTDDLRLADKKDLNETVVRAELVTGVRRFRAKWKRMGARASEVQNGFDGNNAPRCEVGAWRLDRMLFGRDSTERHMVAPVVVRAFHRDVPCDRECARVPRIAELAGKEATFPDVNDHLVLGTLTWWIDGVDQPHRFHGGLWSRERFDRDPIYRKSFGDLWTLLFLEQHGDGNYWPNFLARVPRLDRLYSIDNGRSLDGISYFTDEADPDWDPFRYLDFDHIVPPAFAASTLASVRALDEGALQRELRVVSAIDLASGRSVRDPAEDPRFAAMIAAPLAPGPSLARLGRGAWLAKVEGRSFLVLGIGDQGIHELAERAKAMGARIGPEMIRD